MLNEEIKDKQSFSLPSAELVWQCRLMGLIFYFPQRNSSTAPKLVEKDIKGETNGYLVSPEAVFLLFSLFSSSLGLVPLVSGSLVLRLSIDGIRSVYLIFFKPPR